MVVRHLRGGCRGFMDAEGRPLGRKAGAQRPLPLCHRAAAALLEISLRCFAVELWLALNDVENNLARQLERVDGGPRWSMPRVYLITTASADEIAKISSRVFLRQASSNASTRHLQQLEAGASA